MHRRHAHACTQRRWEPWQSPKNLRDTDTQLYVTLRKCPYNYIIFGGLFYLYWKKPQQSTLSSSTKSTRKWREKKTRKNNKLPQNVNSTGCDDEALSPYSLALLYPCATPTGVGKNVSPDGGQNNKSYVYCLRAWKYRMGGHASYY